MAEKENTGYDNTISTDPPDFESGEDIQIENPDEEQEFPNISDRYQNIKVIGEGGMGAVLEAFDTLLKRPCAIKVLKRGLVFNEKLFQRFQNEAQITASVSHPNIIKIFDISTDLKNPYFVMEKFNGISLRVLIKKKENNPKRLLPIFMQVIKGLHAAHEKDLLHRDIKPENILIDKEDNIKIIDFGLSKLHGLDAPDNMTRTGTVMGSPYYMSPEQCQGTTFLTEKSDIYSVGATFYSLLTGDLPFQADSFVKLMMQHIQAPRPKVIEKIKNCPDELSQLIEQMMAVKPKDRPSYDEIYKKLNDINLQIHLKDTLQGKLPEEKQTSYFPYFLISGFIICLVLFLSRSTPKKVSDREVPVKTPLHDLFQSLNLAKKENPGDQNLLEAEQYIKSAQGNLARQNSSDAFLNVLHSLLFFPQNPGAQHFVKNFSVDTKKKEKSLKLTNATKKYLEKGLLQEAEKTCSLALNADPTNPDIYALNAEIKQRGRVFEDAIKFLSLAILLKPDASFIGMRGEIFFETNRINEAIDDFNRAIKLTPDSDELYYKRGKAFHRSGQFQNAILDFERALSNRKEVAIFQERADCYLQMNKFAEAISDLNEAKNLKPKDPENFRLLGNAHIVKGDMEKAISFFNQGLEVAPDFYPLYLERGSILTKKLKYDLALKDFTKAKKLAPKSPEVFENLGNFFEIQGNLVQAVFNHDQAILLEPNSRRYQNRARLNNILGKFEPALNDSNKSLEYNPENFLAFLSRAIAHEYLGKKELALKDFNQAQSFSPDYNPTYFFRGRYFFNTGKYEKAIKDFTHVINLVPTDASSYYFRCLAYKKRGQKSEMQADWEQYLKLVKNKPAAN
ncbi:protein kinase [Candidatus Riflebacteria bacterium]